LSSRIPQRALKAPFSRSLSIRSLTVHGRSQRTPDAAARHEGLDKAAYGRSMLRAGRMGLLPVTRGGEAAGAGRGGDDACECSRCAFCARRSVPGRVPSAGFADHAAHLRRTFGRTRARDASVPTGARRLEISRPRTAARKRARSPSGTLTAAGGNLTREATSGGGVAQVNIARSGGGRPRSSAASLSAGV
jgi:hypothetical protein